MPLVTGATGEDRYKPFRLGDVQAIIDKMPPVAEGGGLWLEQMGKVTAGHTLALGDFRAVAARCFTVQDLHDIEEAAGLMTEQDDQPLADFIFNISTVLRERYPVSVAAAIPKFVWKPDQHPRAYLEQCKEEWVRKTGQHPGRDESKEWFRTAVLEGVPVSVKQRMCDNPDLPGSDSPVWEKHLVHHLQVVKNKTDKEMQEVQDLQTQLLRLKLGKAREQASEKKKQDKLQMVTSKAPLGPEGEYLANPPNWSNQQSAPHGSGWQAQKLGGYRRGPPRGRGGWRRGGPRGGRPQGLQAGDVCFRCGQYGHWAKYCQAPPQQQPQAPPRGNVMAPHPQAAPSGQFPLGSWQQQ
ncbi:uncharacterized protein LOC106526399 isoform X2 [Austrofundulus limnaeus]|uniref:Uncharacterized protein LOC106526399 isoform X1 n=1 Tax=Austrofundulus limnaeus TaxID=52670 RepID=A0A2I4C904_AUSLI|nr:PREDICTED: uncharacterized protein LOC106526399 isoform X1 [Austrofundulus limnaeus]XP_013876451.1 PREDICTED: uncharacterized protein LOC106526399 isoform X2 [Austrofundulus limnaeus]